MFALMTSNYWSAAEYFDASDGFLKRWRQKKKSHKKEKFLLLLPCFQLYSTLFFHLNEFSVLLSRCFQSRVLQICRMWERVSLKDIGRIHYLSRIRLRKHIDKHI